MSRLADRIMRRPSPPDDERSQRAAEIDALAHDLNDIASHVDRLAPNGTPLKTVLERRLASYGRVKLR